jgi:hypothetical protein
LANPIHSPDFILLEAGLASCATGDDDARKVDVARLTNALARDREVPATVCDLWGLNQR